MEINSPKIKIKYNNYQNYNETFLLLFFLSIFYQFRNRMNFTALLPLIGVINFCLRGKLSLGRSRESFFVFCLFFLFLFFFFLNLSIFKPKKVLNIGKKTNLLKFTNIIKFVCLFFLLFFFLFLNLSIFKPKKSIKYRKKKNKKTKKKQKQNQKKIAKIYKHFMKKKNKKINRADWYVYMSGSHFLGKLIYVIGVFFFVLFCFCFFFIFVFVNVSLEVQNFEPLYFAIFFPKDLANNKM